MEYNYLLKNEKEILKTLANKKITYQMKNKMVITKKLLFQSFTMN